MNKKIAGYIKMATKTRMRKNISILTLTCGVLLGTFFGIRFGFTLVVENYLTSGYGALAADLVDWFKYGMRTSPRSCQAMIASYFQARNAEKVEWAAQACMSAGYEMPAVYIGLSTNRELTGRETEALQILMNGASKFDKSPDIHIQLAKLFKKLKRNDEAAEYYFKATEEAPQAGQLAMDALEFLVSIQKWADARVIAERIKGAATESAEVKLIIAKALIHGGNETSGKSVLEEAKNLLAKAPQNQRKLIEQAYADLLSPSPQGVPFQPNQIAGQNPSQGFIPPGQTMGSPGTFPPSRSIANSPK